MLELFRFVFLVYLIRVRTTQVTDKNENGDDDEIIYNLFVNRSYNSLVRPSSKVSVDINISFRQLVALDEKAGIMTSNLYLSATWYDLI